MEKQAGTSLATLDEYSSKDFNVLRPVIEITAGGREIAPVLVQSVSIVRIDPSAGAGETYHDFRYANERDGRNALTALALTKLANAAGIKWIPDLCKVLERERRADGTYIRFQAGGAVRQPNGEWHVEIAEKDLDTADTAEQLEDGYRRKLKARRAKFGEDDIPEMVRREILQLREFLLGHVETKAKNRVIRRFLTLKQVYSEAELAKPFAVPRLVYRPDLTDPLQLERVQLEGRQASDELFGKTDPFPSKKELPSSEDADSPDASASEDDASRMGKAPANSGPDAAAPGPAAGGDSVATGREATAAGSGRPKSDPVIEDGDYKGQRFSEVTEDHPDYVRALVTEASTKRVRDLAKAWMDYVYPQLVD